MGTDRIFVAGIEGVMLVNMSPRDWVESSDNSRCPALDEGCIIGKMDSRTPCMDERWRACYTIKYGERAE
jgi:hypothetical protein